MTASPLIIPVARFFTVSGGAGLAGGKVYTYAAGTSTPKASYTDYSAGTPNTNPVILDSAGEADIWLDGNYKINVTDSNGVQQANYPVDNVSSFSNGSVSEYGVTTGSANNYILTPTPAIIAYSAGQAFNIKINATNTGPTTINISGLGTKSIVKLATIALTGNELIAGQIYRIVYDGTNFQYLGSTIYGYKSTDIASATTTNLASVTGDFIHITGTTTITSFGTATAGQERSLVFDGILTLTHNATSMILPGGASITTAGGDTAIFRSEGGGNWRCLNYSTTSGQNPTVIDVAHGGTGQTSYTDGQLLIGNSSGNTLTKNTLTAGTGISVTNGNGTIAVGLTSNSTKGLIQAWITFSATGGVIATGAAFNASVVRNSQGNYTVTWSPVFSDANYGFHITAGSVSVDTIQSNILAKTASTIQFTTTSFTPVLGDADFVTVSAFHL